MGGVRPLASRLRTLAASSILFLLIVASFALSATLAFAGTAEEINALPNLDPLNRTEEAFSNAGKWGALAWDTSTSGHNTGHDTTSGWGPYDAFSTVNGAYWTPTAFSDKTGDAAEVTMPTSPGIAERYVALWLDMPSPESAKSGYQLRWTMTNASTNTYSLTLSRWSAGSQTVLASNASVVIAPGATMAISDTGGTVSAWQGSGGSLTSVLSAADSTLTSGYAGIEGAGNITRLTSFKAGALLGAAIGTVAVLDNLERQEVPLATGKWSKTAWSGEIGGAWMGGYRGYGSSGGLAGAYWNPASFSDGGETVEVAGTVGTGSPWEGEYLALWLDMPSPGSARSGYEARFTGTNGTSTAYKVELSKWVSGTRTVLASSTGFSLPVNTTMAMTETSGGGLALWTGSTTMTPVLSASDSTYTSGYAGLEVNGGAGTIYNFRAGHITTQPPNTTITAGPRGAVVPNVSFSFTSTQTGSTFECSLDGAAYSACASPAPYQGLAEGAHTFKVRANGPGGRDESPAERSFEVIAAAKATSKVAVLDTLERQEVPLATGKWSKTSWASEIGGAWMGGYRGYGAGSGLAGAYWNPTTFADNGETVLVSGVVGTGATPEGQYLALWLDMPNPASARSGYEARFTGTNGTSTAYKVELSEWFSGIRIVLASTTGFSLPVNTTMALTETSGGSLTLWTGTSALTPVLSVGNSAYTSGYAGLEVNGGAGTIYNFKAGRMDLQAPDTTIQTGPSGIVSPANVSFTFTSTETGSTFECSLDGAAYSACASPKSYSSLVSGSSHTFRVRAVDAVGNQDATPAERSFKVLSPPIATTAAASGVKNNEVTLHANINPNGGETTYQFEYGTTTFYGSTVPAIAKGIGAGNTTLEATELLTGLQAAVTYHYRISATNAAGTTRGEDRTFRTTAAPIATTESASKVTIKEAMLNASVNPEGAATSYWFEYGTTASYGSRMPASTVTIGSGTNTIAVSQVPNGLTEGTIYHYRVVAENEVGVVHGEDREFSTLLLPGATTEPATSIGGLEAELHGTINPQGSPTTYVFEYGTTTAYGATAPLPAENAGSDTETVDASEVLEGLEPNTTYHYRIVAISPAGSYQGSDMTFSTGERLSYEKESDVLLSGLKSTEGTYTTRYVQQPRSEFFNMMWGGTGREAEGAEMLAIQKFGAKMLRYPINPRGNWSTYELVADNAAKHGITLLPTLVDGKVLSNGQEATRFPLEEEAVRWKEWSEGVERAVKRFGPKGSFWVGKPQAEPETYWEVWNEPNRGANNPDGIHVLPKKYGQLLEYTAKAITKGSGEAKTMMGGLLSLSTKKDVEPENEQEDEEVYSPYLFLEMMGPTARAAYNVMSLHPYAFKADYGGAPTNTKQVEQVAEKVMKNIKKVHNGLVSFGEGNKKIWITELGWPIEVAGELLDASGKPADKKHPPIECTNGNPCQQIQGELVNVTFDLIEAEASKLNVQNVFYYNDRDNGWNTWDYHCGLRDYEGHVRKAAYAFEAEAGMPKWPNPARVQTRGNVRYSKKATVRGAIEPGGMDTKYWFEYGTSTSYGKSTTHQDAGYEEEELEYGAEVTGLTPETTYHYRIAAINENGEPSWGEDKELKTAPSNTETFATVISHNGRPGWVTVEGHVYGEHTINGVYVNVNFQKKENGKFVFKEEESTHAAIENDYYKLEKWSIGEGEWLVVVVFPGFGEDERSESNEHEFTIQAIPTETFLTLDKYANGTPGTASVSGNVFHNGSPVSGTVNVNFQKLVSGSWQTMSTAQRALSNGHYEVINWGVGVGQWRVRAVFPDQDEYAQSESEYHEFSIQAVPTETFLTLDNYVNGTPGTASVSGNVLHNGSGAIGTVNVNFEKWNGSSWQTMSTAQRILSNGHYEVVNWGVGVGQWRVRAVFPEQGDYAQSESSYHEFAIQAVPTETFLTVDKVVKGTPGNVSVSGNVLHNGSGVTGTVNVNFEKWNGSSWQTMSTAQRTLNNGHYEVINWGVGAGQWRVRAVFPEQGNYGSSVSGYHEFTI
jgi:hypothetical protein